MVEGMQRPATIAAKRRKIVAIGLVEMRRTDENPIQFVLPDRTKPPAQFLGCLKPFDGTLVGVRKPSTAAVRGVLGIAAEIESAAIVKAELFERREKLSLRIVANQGYAGASGIVDFTGESNQAERQIVRPPQRGRSLMAFVAPSSAHHFPLPKRCFKARVTLIGTPLCVDVFMSPAMITG